ncbi:PilZ domain-containing protein [Gimesia algae]|uniref:PilZ domain protein n=1 Tax=Gimesia algae TaxID=2527971 RepID=A0A517VLY3_9PLAN|nr:PilZ domain-containing protein [Gimesia algae]QDT93910.1 PilZ domain protein [Gimesia algae]
MNMVLDARPGVDVSEITGETTPGTSETHSISFRKCRQQSGLSLKTHRSASGRTWNSLLNKVRAATNSGQVSKNEPEANDHSAGDSPSFDRRAYPRHTSDAIVLALNKGDHRPVEAGSHPAQKGYAINVSQNGISFASRSAFQQRDELQLTVEDASLNFVLNVSATVVRSTALDQEFWRIDCKLQCPLSNEQVAHLKEYAPSCYVG